MTRTARLLVAMRECPGLTPAGLARHCGFTEKKAGEKVHSIVSKLATEGRCLRRRGPGLRSKYDAWCYYPLVESEVPAAEPPQLELFA